MPAPFYIITWLNHLGDKLVSDPLYVEPGMSREETEAFYSELIVRMNSPVEAFPDPDATS